MFDRVLNKPLAITFLQNLFFSMFSFDSPENIRKSLAFWGIFSGGSKGNFEKKSVKSL